MVDDEDANRQKPRTRKARRALSSALNTDFNDLPGAMVAYDDSGQVIEANRAAVDMLGLTFEQLLGSSAAEAGWLLADSAGGPDADKVHPALAAISSRQLERGLLARVSRADGRELWVQVDAVPALTSTGAVRHVIVTLTDVTGILAASRPCQPSSGDNAVAEVTNQLAIARLDPEAILTTVTTTLSKLRPGTWVACLMNKDPRNRRVVAVSDSDPGVAKYIEQMHLSGEAPATSLVTRVIETGTGVLLPNVPYEEFVRTLGPDVSAYLGTNPPPLVTPVPYVGVLVVPIRSRGAAVGTLGLLERPTLTPLTENDVRWVQVIADRVGLAIENAQFYVDAVSRLERLTALRSVGLVMTGSSDLHLILRVILDQVTAGLSVDAADVLLLDECDRTLRLVASTGFHSTSIPDYRQPVDEVLPGRDLLIRRIETFTTLGAFSQFRRRTLFAREGFRAYGAAPFIARGKLTGVLEVFHRSQLEPDQEWLEFLDALASDAAIAIDNAAMFDKLMRLGPNPSPKGTAPPPDLSRLEMEILGFLVEGLPNRFIAAKVHLSQNTIKFHVHQLLQKLGARNRTELARKATREGWL